MMRSPETLVVRNVESDPETQLRVERNLTPGCLLADDDAIQSYAPEATPLETRNCPAVGASVGDFRQHFLQNHIQTIDEDIEGENRHSDISDSSKAQRLSQGRASLGLQFRNSEPVLKHPDQFSRKPHTPQFIP